jgi:hypothetical protein
MINFFRWHEADGGRLKGETDSVRSLRKKLTVVRI